MPMDRSSLKASGYDPPMDGAGSLHPLYTALISGKGRMPSLSRRARDLYKANRSLGRDFKKPVPRPSAGGFDGSTRIRDHSARRYAPSPAAAGSPNGARSRRGEEPSSTGFRRHRGTGGMKPRGSAEKDHAQTAHGPGRQGGRPSDPADGAGGERWCGGSSEGHGGL